MKTVTVKANNQVGTVAEHTVVTQNNISTVIRATDKTNYELLDTASGRALKNIVTKRVDKDLHVSFENNSENADLIIEGFYDDIDSALVGVAEDGSYYYYLPDTGDVTDYVTELQVGEVQSQSLGGEAYSSPWWIGATEAEGFATLPWLLGLAGVGVAAAALGGGGGDDNDSAPVDTTAPDAPTDIYIGNDDAFINAAEIDENGNVDVIIGLPDNASAGDIITVNDIKQELTNDDIKSGNVTVKIGAPPEGETLEITASITDAAGNESDELTEAVGIVDTIAPGEQDDADQVAPAVAIAEAADGVNATEFSNGVQTQVTLPTGTVVGDTVILTVKPAVGEAITVDYVVTADDLDVDGGNGVVEVTIPNDVDDGITADGDYSVTATVTDEAGNVSETSAAVDFTVDTVAPGGEADADIAAPIMGIDEAEDGVNATEFSNGVQTQVTLPTGTVAGDTVTLIVTSPDNNTITVNYRLTSTDIASNSTNGFVEVTIPNDVDDGITADGDYSVTATVTDVAGNVSATSESVSFTVDTAPPGAPNIAIGNGNEFITVDEIVNDQVSVTVVLPDNAVVGDTVTVNNINKVLDNNIIDDGNGRRTITFNVDAPGEGAALLITASITDAADNESSSVTATATRNTAGAPDAPVSVDIGDGSPFINVDEIINDQVSVTVVLSDNAAVGDTVTVNNIDKVLDNNNIIDDSNGRRTITFNFDAPLEGLPFEATATIKSGGVSSTAVSTSAIRDTIVPDVPIVTIGDGDDTVNGFDLATADQVTVTVDLQAETSVGDLISINGGAGVAVTQAMLDGVYVTTVPLPAAGEVLTVTATVTDQAGNSSEPTTVTATVGDIDASVIEARDDLDILDLGDLAITLNTAPVVDFDLDTTVDLLGVLSGPVNPSQTFNVPVGTTGSIDIKVEVDEVIDLVSGAVGVEVYDSNGNLAYFASTGTPPLVGNVLGIELLGLTGGEEGFGFTLPGLAPGNYTVVVGKSQSAVAQLVNDVVLEPDQLDSTLDAALDTVSSALGPLGPLVTGPINAALSSILDPLAENIPNVGTLIEQIKDIPLIGAALTPIVNAITATATSILDESLLTLFSNVQVTGNLTTYSFDTDTEITGNVIDPDQGLNGELGEDVVTPNTKVTEVNGVSADVNTGIITVNGQYGVLEIDADGDYTYTANGDYSSSGQSDTFTYTIYDSVTGDSDTA